MIAATTGHFTLQAAQRQGIGGQAKVGFRLAAAGSEPQEVRHRVGFVTAIGMMQVGEARQVEQNESHLEQTPAAVLSYIDSHRPVLDFQFLLAHLAGKDGMDTLLPHGAVGEAEGFFRKWDWSRSSQFRP